MLDLRRLQYLEAVYKYQNFTRASEALFVSQPTISTAISSMERELGIKLISRTSREVHFTVEGEQFMPHVLRILRECREAEGLLDDLSRAGDQTLRLGISPTLGELILPLIYSDFLPQWPQATVHLDEGSMNNHIEKILNDVLDLSYNALPRQGDLSTLTLVPVTTVEICAVMNPGHPLAAYEKLPIGALEGQSVVMLDSKSMIHTLVSDEFSRKGVVPHVVSCHEQIMSMVNMVRLGNYIGFININERHCAMGCDGLEIRSLESPITFEAGFLLKKGRHIPKIARELISFMRSTLAISP